MYAIAFKSLFQDCFDRSVFRVVYDNTSCKDVKPMRKLLHAIYGMLKHDADFNGAKFYALAG